MTRKGLDWVDKFGAIATASKALPDALIETIVRRGTVSRWRA